MSELAFSIAGENMHFGSLGRSMTRKALQAKDPPTLRYKVAMCLYALMQEGSVKVKADVGSIGQSTLRGWLKQFADGVMKVVKPIYMPTTPHTEEERAAAQMAMEVAAKAAKEAAATRATEEAAGMSSLSSAQRSSRIRRGGAA